MSNLDGQVADFPFNADFNDLNSVFSPTLFGEPTIETDTDGERVLKLEGDEFLSLPNALHESLDPNEDVEIHIRFKITDTYQDTPYEGTEEFGEDGRRVLISNRYFGYSELGFDIFTEYDEENLKVIMAFGDGINDGQRIWNVTIAENEWVDLKVKVQFNRPDPRVVFKLNGRYNNFEIMPMYLDAEVSKRSFNTQQIWVGTAMDDDLQWGDYAYAETLIDFIKIYNPPFVGNAAEVAGSINALRNHVNSTAPLSPSQQQGHLSNIVDNWDDNTYSTISADVQAYMSTYEEERGTVFSFYGEYLDPAQIVAPKALQFMLIEYFIDNLYSSTNVANMEGISFLDHELLPGPVAAAAPRVSQSITIDGDYNTDPGFFLNNSSFVVRPTGYYVAPGELVTVTLPASVVNQGVRLHVGAQYIDLREGFRGFQRFPLMATRFPVVSTTTTVANPFGGAIYLVFPDGSNFGEVTMAVSNAVKSPYYSSKTGFSNSLTQYQTDLSNAYVNWVDLESNNFQVTFPKALAELEPNANLILGPLNEIIAQYNIMAGRPSKKIRSEYMISEPQLYSIGTYPASYPISIPNEDLNEAYIGALPVSVTVPSIFMRTYDGTTLIHELGHLHGLPTMDEEWETNVDVPNVMAFNNVFNLPLDTALYYSSGFQYLDGNNAALDWILDPKFRQNLPTEYLEVSYQLRGVAKYVDVARLFSWDSLGVIHKYWYDAQLATGTPSEGSREVTASEFVQVASDQLGFNFAPLWHLWGSIPDEATIANLAGYAKEDRIKERILHYRSLVPMNRAQFQAVHAAITPAIENHHGVRYDNMLTYYDEAVADSILTVIDNILCTYYDTNCNTTSVEVNQQATSIKLQPNPTDGIFEITGLGQGDIINIVASNGVTLRSINTTAYTQFVDISDLPAGLFFVQIINKNNASVILKKMVKK